jgi:hypothetical protein
LIFASDTPEQGALIRYMTADTIRPISTLAAPGRMATTTEAADRFYVARKGQGVK